MNNAIKTTIKKEIRGFLRDRKSLLIMLLTPILIPTMIFMFSFVYDSMTEEIIEEKMDVGINYELTNIEKEIIKDTNIKIKSYSTEKELQKAYKKEKISAYIMKEKDEYIIYTNKNNQDSSLAGTYIANYLQSYNKYMADNYLLSIDADASKVYNNVNYTFAELKGSNDMVNSIINMGLLFSIMSISLTAIYCATDSIAGEKERGTLETFLTFPIKNEELITGKFLAIVVASIITSIISTTLTITSFIVVKNMFDIYKDAVININALTIATSLFIMIGFSIFISGLCIAISSTTKTYKEAQSSLTPISLLTMIPIFLNVLEVKMTPILSLIPLVNHTMLLNTIYFERIKTSDLINITIMFVSTVIYSIILIKLITKQFKSEKVLFSIK